MNILVDARLLRSGGIGRYVREIVGRWIAGGSSGASGSGGSSGAGNSSGPSNSGGSGGAGAEGVTREIRLLGDPAELAPWVEALRRERGLSSVGGEGTDCLDGSDGPSGAAGSPAGSASRAPAAPAVTILPWFSDPYHWKGQLGWMREWKAWSAGMDVAFFPHWDVPVAGGGPPRVVTVHDRIHFEAPGGFPRWKRAIGELLLRRAVEDARRVLTVSSASAHGLVRVFPRLEGKLEVVLNGCGDGFRPLSAEDDADPRVTRWRPHRPFLLFVGPLKAHKNAALALRVLEALAGDHPEVVLVQVGPKEVRDPAVATLLGNPSIARRFLQAGPVDDAELRILYGLCECLLHPALIEGFGLPPLEAMACGVPVLAADRSSLPEVVGEGGLLLDPDRPEPWIEAVRKCLSDPESRRALARRGPAQAARFSWDRTAARTLEVLRSVAAGEQARRGTSAASPPSNPPSRHSPGSSA